MKGHHLDVLVAAVIGLAVGVLVRRAGVFPRNDLARAFVAAVIAAAIVSGIDLIGAHP